MIKPKMNKIEFNGTEFEVIENNLDVLESATPIFVKYRKLQAEYLDDIDTSLVDSYLNRIAQLRLALSQIEKLNPADVYDGEQTNEQKCEELKKKIETLESEFENNEECAITLKLKSDIESILISGIALDRNLMSRLYRKILKGDIGKIDYTNPDYKFFAIKVLESFFSVLQRSGNGLMN